MEERTGDKLIGQLREQVNNLLAAVQLLTPLVREQGTDRERNCLAIMNQSLYRLLRTLSHLDMDRGAGPVFRPVPLDLARLCRELGRVVEDLAPDVEVGFHCELGVDCLLTQADGDLVALALLNLISNAMEAAGKGGHVALKLAKKDGRAVFTVRDDGPGLRQADGAEDPLLSRREGLGLGLTAARRAASLHGGTLVLENRETGGVRAVLSLPIQKGEGGLLKSPTMGYDLGGGFSPVLVELSGLLPYRTFLPRNLEP